MANTKVTDEKFRKVSTTFTMSKDVYEKLKEMAKNERVSCSKYLENVILQHYGLNENTD